MKKRMIIPILTLISSFAIAQNKIPSLHNSKTAGMEKFGGTVKRQTNGKSVLIADMCTNEYFIVSEFIKKTSPALKVTFDLKRSRMPSGDKNKSILGFKDKKHPAVVAVIEEADYPVLSVFPEDSVAIVNIERLKTDDLSRFKVRVAKELSRAVGFILGAYAIPRPGCVLEFVQNPEQLDKLSSTQLSPFRYINVYRALEKLDIPDSREVPYVRAVREGWAPSPTNDVQRKIVKDWEVLKKKRDAKSRK